MIVNNSTITGNVEGGSAYESGGGGISNQGNLTISNSTLSANSANPSLGSGGISGGIQNFSGYTTTLQNSIIANNSGGNCSGTMTSKGYNLSSDDTCNFNSAGDWNNTDPKLGTLGYNGGPTQTIPAPWKPGNRRRQCQWLY